MRVGSITNTVYTFHDRVHRRVITDGVICTIQVVIDGARQTDAGEIKLHTKVPGTSQ